MEPRTPDQTANTPMIGRRGLLGLAAATTATAALATPRPSMAAVRRGAAKAIPAQTTWTAVPEQAPAREGLAQLGDVGLWYSDTGGSGEPIVLAHPATGSYAIWGYQQPVLARAGYRVISYSRRGFYKSESGPSERTGSASGDLKALLDYLKVDRFHFLGSAAGGFLLPDFELSYPGRVISMIFACTQGGVVEPAYRQRISDVTPPAFFATPESFRELGPSYRAANREGVAAWEALHALSQSGPRRVSQTPQNRILWSSLQQIQTPSLVFTGAADLYMPVPLMLEYASHLPNAETAIFAESGHSAYWEQPVGFNALVLGFIRRNRLRRGR